MQVQEYVIERAVVIEPHGALAEDETGAFSEAVTRRLREDWDRFIVNLEHTTSVDSLGIAVLIQAFIAVHRRGARFALVHVTGKARELLTVTRLLSVFDVYETLQSAKLEMRPPASGTIRSDKERILGAIL